jgi:hypothetical protein
MSSKIILVEEGTDAATPSTGQVALYAKTDSALYMKDDAGNVTKFLASGPATALAVAMAVALG